ncbi:MAG: SH3-like domain-containing protein [Egibacteraceae bacterium]
MRVRLDDPAGHTRAPRYVRGHVGVVVEADGVHPLPDAVIAGADPLTVREPVYAVRFAACDLWGVGDHSVTVTLWETYLEAAP